jgi:hypothetical protein
MPIVFDDLSDSQRMIVIQNAVLEQQVKLDNHHKILVEGTDKDLPIVERTRNLEGFVAGFKFWQRTIAVALVIQTVTFGTAALVYFAKLYPLLEKIANQP